MWKAYLETQNFTFEAYGMTEKDAWRFLVGGWKIHCIQTQADFDLLKHEDVQFTEIAAGDCYRDREVINQCESW